MYKNASLLCLTAIAALQTAGATELTGSPQELEQYLQSKTRVVTIRDIATESAYTDVAKITLIVTTDDKSLAESLETNAATRERVRRQLIDAGIDPDNVNSAKYSASPQYGWFGKKPASFEVVNSLQVEVDSESHFQHVAEIADREDTIRFGGVEFEHSEDEQYKHDVREKALQKVLADAAYFESKLGLTLSPVAFQFSDVGVSGPEGGAVIEEIVVTSQRSGVRPGFSAAPPPAPPTFDEVSYRASVQVTFEITPAGQ